MPTPDNRRKKHPCPPYFNTQIFVLKNKVEVRCMIIHVKMLLVGCGCLIDLAELFLSQ